MNYIDLINQFWEKDQENYFSDREISLYFYLLNTCNRLSWKNPFGQSNAMMIARFGWGKSSFDSAKKKLKEAGLIDFKPGDGRGNVYQYRIIGENVNKKGNKKSTLSDTLSRTLSDTLSRTLSDSKPETSLNINLNLNENLKGDTPLPPLQKKNDLDLKTEIKKKKYDEIREMYHRICPSFPKIRELSDARKKQIECRLKEMGGAEVFEKVFEKMENSNFLRGENERNWQASFDWVLKNSTNWLKIIEGNYENNKNYGKTDQGNNGQHGKPITINKFREEGFGDLRTVRVAGSN